MDTFLKGRCIWVTRPDARAANLCALIEAAGGEALRFSTLEIALSNDVTAQAMLAALDQFDLAIFVSPTAVEAAFTIRNGMWPQALRTAAVGGSTARALAARGVRDVIAPTGGADSEALAALPELQAMTGKRVLIVRGEGGREWLADTLRARGAEVEYAECYKATFPMRDPAAWDPVRERWAKGSGKGGIDAITAYSRDALTNLVGFLEPDGRMLRATPLFAAHERIVEHAKNLGFGQIVTFGTNDAALLAALRDFFGRA